MNTSNSNNERNFKIWVSFAIHDAREYIKYVAEGRPHFIMQHNISAIAILIEPET